MEIDAQMKIEADQSAKYMGDSVTVCGKVFSGKYLDQSKEAPTFLNINGHYPKQQLTLVIMKDVRQRFSYDPLKRLVNKNVCVTGKIKDYKGKPEIMINNEAQIVTEDE
jgi:micrococcal nuclease